MASAQPCTHFDTPEGKWVLVSKFQTEDAANQFLPNIAKDIGADDLCAGASNSSSMGTVSPTVNGPIRFGAASTAMAAGGLMFPSTPTAPTPPPPPPTAATRMYAQANRPTHVAIFQGSRSDEPTDAHSEQTADISGGSSSASVAKNSRKSSFMRGWRTKEQNEVAVGKGIVTKCTSTYVSRMVTTENLAKWIVDEQSVFLVFNAPRCLTWAGVSEAGRETLARLDLTGTTPLCHAVSVRSASRVDIIMGFVHGDMIWYEPVSGKYARLNKNSGYGPAITCVKWLPDSDTLFMAGTADGAVMIMDRTKEDFYVPGIAHANRKVTRMDHFEVARQLKPRSNPVAYWKLSNRAITSLAFAPDMQRVAATCEDGGLRVIDYMNELLEDVYLSYFGGLTCAAWSPDARYIVAGGKDDQLTVFGYYEQMAVARCTGHLSWVTDVQFDPTVRNAYRFMSVGEDAQLLVWDFSLPALHRPRLHRTPSHQAGHVRHSSDLDYLHGPPGVDDAPSETVHGRVSRDGCAVLQPLVSERIHEASLCGVQFSQDLLVTACRQGVVKVWRRPVENVIF